MIHGRKSLKDSVDVILQTLFSFLLYISFPLLSFIDTGTLFGYIKESNPQVFLSWEKNDPEDVVQVQKGRKNGNATFLLMFKTRCFQNRCTRSCDKEG